MADESFKGTKGWLEIVRGNSELIRDIHKIQRTLAVGGNTAKVGMIMTGVGETHPGVDIIADGDESFLGLLMKPLLRPSDTWDIDDALTDATEVIILKPGSGALVGMWITGLTGGGTAKAGDPVYIQDFTPNALASANITLGAGMVIPNGTDVFDDTTADLTRPLVQIGTLAQDLTIGDSTSAAAGKIALVNY